MPTDAIWLDTETTEIQQPEGYSKHVLKFGYASYRRTYARGKWTDPSWLRFESITALWNFVESKLHGKIKLYLFAHNWGFDAPVLDLFNELPARGFELKSAVIDSPPVILKFRRDKQSICVIDTLNIWKVPLAKIGESLGLPKLQMPDTGASREAWDAYGKRDVEIIMQACMQWWNFLRDNDLGGFAPTISSQALRTYRHRFMKHDIFIDDNEKALALARKAFYGGRTECFYIGRVPFTVHKMDINAMYPHIMRTEKMPARLIGRYSRSDIDELAKLLKKYCCVAAVDIHTDEPAYPVLSDNKLIFPVGLYTTYLCTSELKYALEQQHIVRVREVSVYEPEILFADYVDFFQSLRDQAKARGDDAESDRAKRMQNHLFGKFGQNGRVYKIIDAAASDECRSWSEIDLESGEVYRLRQYSGILEQYQEDSESRDSHPAIAAHVTSAARMYLWRLIRQAGQRNIIYCDTDSLWLSDEGLANVTDHVHSVILGKLKCEGVHRDVIIHGLKDYILDGRRRTKGVKDKARQLSDNVFEQVQFSNLKGLLSKGDLQAPRTRTMVKRLKRNYTKGTVDASGWVSPLRLPLNSNAGG